MGLDYLATRDDIDVERLAYFGMSWGASADGLISAAIETRYRAVVLIAAGIELYDPNKLPEANPINFVPYIRPPKLMIQGKYDEEFPLATHASPLFELLREPKQLIVVDWGHLPPLEARVAAINNFLDETLGPVKFE
jgi:pimeloyl-ACP methyl ester carboxylesterase